MPRPEVLDPQGRAVAHALDGLGYGVVKSVRVGRIVDVELLEGVDRQEAQAKIEQMTRELLANLVIEDFRIDWMD